MTRILTMAAAVLLTAGFTGAAQAQITFTDETGEIGPGDRRDGENNLYDEYSFTANAGERLRISVNNLSDLDPYVIVYGPSGAEIARNDDANDSLNAQVLFNVPQSGAYRVVVRGFLGSTGRYRVIMENLTPPRPPVRPNPGIQQVLPEPGLFSLGNDYAGTFSNSSPRLPGETRHYQDFRVSLSAGQELVVNMDSAAFDSYLWVYAANNMATPLMSNDDSNGTLNATILFTAPRTGIYIFRASQLSHGDGAYRLRARRLIPAFDQR